MDKDKYKFIYAMICAMQEGEVVYEWVIGAALKHMTPEQLLEHCHVEFESVEEFIETYDDGFGPYREV